ncbi:MAG: tRNA (adenosine(37)-N6)-threonylcarbamoyltransferase complex dimerization subunit type 1 TsaB [Bacteroidota bacterium]
MAIILCIETATEICSVALARDEKLLEIKESSVRNVHSAMLTLFIDEIVKSSGFKMDDLDAIAVSMGPGSYTGLRIGVATSKGLCYALDKPLISVPTLQAMAAGMNDKLQMKNGKSADTLQHQKSKIGNQNLKILFCPLIDARRMEVFSELYDKEGKSVREVKAEIIDDYSFQGFLSDNRVVFAGPGADKCQPFLRDHTNAQFLMGFRTSAQFMIGIAEKKYSQSQFENLAYFEPFYLKDFVAGKPRVKGLT